MEVKNNMILKTIFTAKEGKISMLSPKTRYQFLATLIVNIISFGLGLTIGWLSPMLYKIQAPDSPLQFKVTVTEISWIGSLSGIGGICGNIVAGLLLDRMGRKFCIYLIAFPFMCSWILVFCATRVEFLYVARLLSGFTGGSVFVIIPIFVSEIADTKIRGALLSLLVFAVNCGILAGYIIASHLAYHLIPFVALFLSVSYLIANLFLPETTQHLLRTGKLDAAEKSFIFYRNLKNEDSSKYRDEFNELCNIITENQSSQFNYRDLISKSAIRSFAFVILFTAGFMFSGGFPFVNYTSEIFTASGSVFDPNTSTIIVGIVQIVGSLMSTLLVDILGRRILMLISIFLFGVGCTTFGIYTHYAMNHNLTAYNWVPLALMMINIFVFNIGMVGCSNTVIVESFSVKIRAMGTAINGILTGFYIFLTLKMFPLLLRNYGISITMWFSAVISLATFLHLIFFLKETKGKSMDKD